MTKIAREASELIESLPAEEARQVIGFARYLAERAAEEAWTKSLKNPKARSRFRKFAKAAMKDHVAGRSTALDPDRM